MERLARGEGRKRWAANEPCRKGCGIRPDGRTYGGWSVHEATCTGTPPKYANVRARGERNRDPKATCEHGTAKSIRCYACTPRGKYEGDELPESLVFGG